MAASLRGQEDCPARSAATLVTGPLHLFGTLLMSVRERLRGIGMIAAMGWSGGRIIALVMIEGLILGIGGAVGGLASFTPGAAHLVLSPHPALPLCGLGAAERPAGQRG